MAVQRIALVGLASALLLGAGAGSAGADIGAGVGAVPIALDVPARAGVSYDLLPLFVVNTGSESGTYRVRVAAPTKARATDLHAPTTWVRFGRNDFALAAGESARVPIRLSVPADALPGRYRANLVVSTVKLGGPSGPAGAGVGASAATELRFRVPRPAGTESSASWTGAVVFLVAVAAVLALMWIVLRRRRRGAVTPRP